MTENTEVVVIGGGYAGVMAANRMTRRGVTVTLINPRPAFVERIRLHQRQAVGERGTQARLVHLGQGRQSPAAAAGRVRRRAGHR